MWVGEKRLMNRWSEGGDEKLVEWVNEWVDG